MCKITAPDDEPQRGTVIQTDDSGRIATMPTDDGKSRIISRDEYDRLNTPQGRSAGEARAEMGFGREQDLARQASRGISAFGPPSARANAPDVMGGFMPGDVNIEQTSPMGINLFRDRDAQARRLTNDFGKLANETPSFLSSDGAARANIGLGTEQMESRIARMLGNNKKAQMINRRVDDIRNNFPDVNADEAIQIATDEYNKGTLPELINANPSQADMMTTIQEEAGVDPVNFASDSFQFPEGQNLGARLKNPNELFQEQNVVSADLYDNRGLGEGRLGGNMVGTSSRVPQFTTARSQAGQPNMGVTDSGIRSLASRFGEDDFQREAMVNPGRIADPMYQDYLKSQDSMFAGAVNKLGKIMGYDDPFELFKATQETVKRNKGLEADRNRDKDRAMQSQSTQQPFDPCPAGYKYDPAKRKCEPIEKEETELGQKFVRNPVAFAGDPNMYGRTGGEYNFFTEVPGLIKAANGIPRGPTGEIRGQGGPKDDLVGPFMLSDQEYVLPKEMIMAAGGGNYDTGIKQLETMRKNSLNKYGDYV